MNDFRRNVLKVTECRNHKIKNSIGVYDIYKHIRRNNWYNIGLRITEHLFYTIIRKINQCLADNLIKGKDIKLPYRLGKIEVRKYFPSIKIKDGIYGLNIPIDWDTTLKLWEEDLECYDNRTMIRLNISLIFRIRYNKSKAVFNNKSIFLFFPNRQLKVALKQAIKDNNFDAFIL